MAKKQSQDNQKTILEQVYDYQTRLQGVANDLAVKLAAVALKTDEPVAKFIAKELPKKKSSIKAELERMQKLIAKVEAIRKPTYKAAKDLIFSTSADVMQAGTDETAKEFNKALGDSARKEREKRFCKTLTPQQQKAIIDGQAISGATIADWYKNWQRKDLETISSACQKASIEELTVRDIYRLIRGTRENNYSDGVLATTQTGAVTLARTIINGVANNARVETIKENSDVIDGIKFLGTLDGKTCPHCASLDGYIWRGEDMVHARRPPIHPNCRCALIPYVELKDDEGNVVEVDSERPAANADFDELAKKAYNDNAKQNGWSRRWDDLAPSTRLKYYYQAQKDFEAQTGQKAYKQVPASLTFADYFKKQSNDFKRSWLGAKRFELYQQGKLKEDQIFAPNLGYMATAKDLFQISKVDQQTAEELAEIAKKQGEKIKQAIDAQKKEDKKTKVEGTDPEYKEEAFLFKVETDTFKHLFRVHDMQFKNFNLYNLERLEDVNAVISALEQWRNTLDETIGKKEPKKEDYTSFDNFLDAHGKWSVEKATLQRYAMKLSSYLSSRQYRLKKEGQKEGAPIVAPPKPEPKKPEPKKEPEAKAKPKAEEAKTEPKPKNKKTSVGGTGTKIPLSQLYDKRELYFLSNFGIPFFDKDPGSLSVAELQDSIKKLTKQENVFLTGTQFDPEDYDDDEIVEFNNQIKKGQEYFNNVISRLKEEYHSRFQSEDEEEFIVNNQTIEYSHEKYGKILKNLDIYVFDKEDELENMSIADLRKELAQITNSQVRLAVNDRINRTTSGNEDVNEYVDTVSKFIMRAINLKSHTIDIKIPKTIAPALEELRLYGDSLEKSILWYESMRKKYGAKKAAATFNEWAQLTKKRKTKMTHDLEQRVVLDRLRQLRELAKNAKSSAEKARIDELYDRAYEMRSDLTFTIAGEARDVSYSESHFSEKNSETNAQLIQTLFPEGEGKVFFDQKYINSYKDAKAESIAKVLRFFNTIAKSVNTGKTKVTPPTIQLVDSQVLGQASGDYNHSTNTVRILNTLEGERFCKVLAHELGHWLDAQAKSTIDNAKFILDNSDLSYNHQSNRYSLTMNTYNPCLTARLDHYGNDVYFSPQEPSNKDEMYRSLRNSECMSTFCETLYERPSILTMCSPDQFNQGMKTLQKLQ